MKRAMVLVALLVPAAALAKPPGKGPPGATVKKDVKAGNGRVLSVEVTGQGEVRPDYDRQQWYWVKSVVYVYQSEQYPGLQERISCLATYYWSGRWTFQSCRENGKSFLGVDPPPADVVAAGDASIKRGEIRHGTFESALDDPIEIVEAVQPRQWQFTSPYHAWYKADILVWLPSGSDHKVKQSVAANIYYARENDKSPWAFSNAGIGEIKDLEKVPLPPEQRGVDAPTLKKRVIKEQYAAAYATWKVPALTTPEALAAFAYKVTYQHKELVEWEAFMHQWWPDDAEFFKGAERFWWSDKANHVHSWGLSTALRDRRADFLANYCPTMKVGKVEQRGADTVFHIVNKAGQASGCSITVSPRRSKAGALAITDIGCSPRTGAAELDPATACK